MDTNAKKQPPCSNKGGTQGKTPGTPRENPQLDKAGVQGHLDWLTYTAPYQPAEEDGHAIGRIAPPYPEFMPDGETCRAIHGYAVGMRLGIGTVSYSPDDRRQKVAIQITGEGWMQVDQENIPPEAILKHIYAEHGKPTRVDFALDLFEHCDTAQVYAQWKQGKVKTRMETAGLFEGAKRVDGKLYVAGTSYLGSSTSYYQLRVYDKQREQGVSYPWTRIELIARKEGADRLARAMLQSGIVPAGQAAIRKAALVGLDWYKRAVEGPAVHLAPIVHPERDTVRWLLNDVVPVMERELLESAIRGDNRLLKALDKLLTKYRSDTAGSKHWTKKPPKKKIDDIQRYT